MNKASLLSIAVFLATCCFAQALVAQNAPTKRRFKIDQQVLLPNGDGNASPIRVRITRVPAVPLAKDQHFHAMVHVDWDADATESWSTGTELSIPAGKTSAEVELLFSPNQSNYCRLLIEQGKIHTRSGGNDLFYEQIQTSLSKQLSDSWLLISSNAPKEPCAKSQTVSLGDSLDMMMGGVISGMPQGNFIEAFRDGQQITGLKTIFGTNLSDVLERPNWHALQPNELPNTWVGLSSIRRVLISNDEFKSLTQVPAYRKIIQQWVATGGHLFVFNSSNSLSHADSLFPLLLGSESATSTRRWSPMNSVDAPPRSSTSKQWQSKPLKSSELTARNAMASSPYVNGRVIAMIAPEKLRNLSTASLPSTIRVANPFVRKTRNDRFSPIPGVGKPPIALFGVFTALFLFIIGPVILIVVTLNNNRRFLFFLVPVFSFLTCTSILGYAIVADFNKQLGRTQTITVLDSQAGVAFTRASSAYYCGSQPSYYAYDTDTLVQTTTGPEAGYRIHQLPEENRLSSPRIQPRKIHEVFTAKPYPTQQRFRVTDSTKQPGTPEVTNLLGSRIEKAAFEFKGKIYLVNDVAPKQTALGVETTPAECRKELYQPISAQKTKGGSPIFYSSTSRITTAVNRFTINRVPPREFIAIIDTNPAIGPLIEPFDYKLQLHVVHGKHN